MAKNLFKLMMVDQMGDNGCEWNGWLWIWWMTVDEIDKNLKTMIKMVDGGWF